MGDIVKCAFDVKCENGALVLAAEITQNDFFHLKKDVLC